MLRAPGHAHRRLAWPFPSRSTLSAGRLRAVVLASLSAQGVHVGAGTVACAVTAACDCTGAPVRVGTLQAGVGVTMAADGQRISVGGSGTLDATVSVTAVTAGERVGAGAIAADATAEGAFAAQRIGAGVASAGATTTAALSGARVGDGDLSGSVSAVCAITGVKIENGGQVGEAVLAATVSATVDAGGARVGAGTASLSATATALASGARVGSATAALDASCAAAATGVRGGSGTVAAVATAQANASGACVRTGALAASVTATAAIAGTKVGAFSVEITSPSPPVALYSGVGQEFSGTFSGSPTEVKLYLDSGYTELAAEADLGSGTWTATVTPVYSQVGLTTLYARAYDGADYAYDDCAITVTQRTPLDILSGISSYHRADDTNATTSGGSPDKFTMIPDEEIDTSDSQLVQSNDAYRLLVRSTDSNFAGRRTAYNGTHGNTVHCTSSGGSQVYATRVSGKFTTICLGCNEQSGSGVGLLFSNVSGTLGAGRYADGTLVFADGGSARTTSHTLRVGVPFALRVEWDDTGNQANWYIRYDDGTTDSGAVTWNQSADYVAMYLGGYGYGFGGAFCEISCTDGALGAGEWDAYVAQWLQGRHGWT